MEPEIEIGGRKIGSRHPPYIICELSGNHNGSLDRALKMLDLAAKTGCDAIKIQTYTPESLTIESTLPDFFIRSGPWKGMTLYQLYEQAHTPLEWHPLLFKKAKELGITLLSTPFDESGVDLLMELGVPAFKIASFEAVDIKLIRYVAKQRKPMIISTGLANLREISLAVSEARDSGCSQLALLHCVSSYPAPAHESNLRTIPHLSTTFNCVSGLSDHSLGSEVAVSAVVLGASIIEKHFTISRKDIGPDSHFSLEPSEFKKLVDDCKSSYSALGEINYERTNSERNNLIFRRSLYVIADIKKGEKISPDKIRSIRPGYGLAPVHIETIVEGFAARDLMRGEPLQWSMIDFVR